MSSQETSPRKLILPKGYLSYSQWDLWNKSQDRYKREYFEKGKRLDTRYLRFGKGIAKAIEDREIHKVLPTLIVYENIEFRLHNVIRGIPVLSYLDTHMHVEMIPGYKSSIFREFKTGKRQKNGDPAWNQAKVQKHDQLPFYAVQLRAIDGVMPAYCDLDWMETEEGTFVEGGLWSEVDRLKLTGQVKSFRRYFDERELDRIEEDIVRVANEISDAYYEFITEL